MVKPMRCWRCGCSNGHLMSCASKGGMPYMLMEQILAEKEEKLVELRSLHASLKPTFKEYLKLWDAHIKPLMPAIQQFQAAGNEIIKLEHQLQGQRRYTDHKTTIQDKLDRMSEADMSELLNKIEKVKERL